MKKSLFILFLFAAALSGFATHNRAGEITYTRISPTVQVVGGTPVQVFNYLITVTKYTDDGTSASLNNPIQDRCTDTIYFGDATYSVVTRSNGGSPLCSGCAPCGCPHCGELIISDPNGYRVKLNTYTVTHTYPGAGSYTIHTADPDRNDGVYNMTNSGMQSFYLESVLVIENSSGANSSPQFLNRPTDKACMGKCFYHNPGAYDPDGDSLSFELSTPRGENGQTVIGYFPPNANTSGSFSINPVTGLVTWCVPTLIEEYNIAFIVKEWRRNVSGTREVIGYVLRDMQVIVTSCPNNNPPLVTVPPDTCVEAGTFLQKSILVTDVVISPPANPNTNNVMLSGAAGAFSALNPEATLSNTLAFTPYTSVFSWQTSCDHIRKQPYQTVFKVEDQGPGSALVNFSTYSIKVVPPSIKNVSAMPDGSSMDISWLATACNPATNSLTAYYIYRRTGCAPFVFDPCATMIDPASGFVSIGHTPPGVLTYTDSNAGNGLTVGQEYSYLVIAVYKDGSQSYASAPVCAKLKRNIPVILNADVRATSNTAGSVYIRWARPLTNTGNLDTIALPGPYKFILNYRSGASGNFNPVYTSSSPYFLSLDTFYLHTGINTFDSMANYRVELISDNTSVGASPLASSIFLNAVGGDRKISLAWQCNTPWSNYKYTIQRRSNAATAFTSIATTTLNSYTDTTSIENLTTYCYRIIGEGQYSDPTIYKPLINYSQEACATAKDLVIPCTPTLSINADCEDTTGLAKIMWTDVKNLCSNDVVKYVLFYKPTLGSLYAVVDTLGFNSTSYTYDGLTQISGCYAIRSVDLSGNASLISPDFCIDNCPEFELPNIFSPNGDNSNDVYKAIKVRQVKEIELSIFDRWGNLVYKTRDPYFQWDGTSLQSKAMVSQGTFFYFCKVYENRFTGLKQRELKGYLQLVK